MWRALNKGSPMRPRRTPARRSAHFDQFMGLEDAGRRCRGAEDGSRSNRMKLLSVFTPRIAPYVIGCPEPLIEQKTLDAYRLLRPLADRATDQQPERSGGSVGVRRRGTSMLQPVRPSGRVLPPPAPNGAGQGHGDDAGRRTAKQSLRDDRFRHAERVVCARP